MGKLEHQYIDPATHEADFATSPGRLRRQQDLSQLHQLILEQQRTNELLEKLNEKFDATLGQEPPPGQRRLPSRPADKRRNAWRLVRRKRAESGN